MLADQPSSAVGGRAAPLEIRIHADGEVGADLTAELGGLVATPLADGTLLRGTVVDAAELWGVLHRLHRAGLRLRSLERPCAGPAPDHAGPDSEPPGEPLLARVEVDGHAAGVVSVILGAADVYQNPPSTTLVFRLGTEDALFEVLDTLEDLALTLRGIHVDG
ncbi:hypothetical protein H5398_12560 [Tessaracoccus sp. MC1679]|uniref:hypothetical protein n=1 Tax=unclassified Tessaracoccus TaxID=2635419 RepID=UPI001600B00B|nr:MULTISPECIES: hypothetical protein [unclassified Tessaracoccus]MBB1511282.1 hypothetical protein [Tessaracoccus sp. MC1627]MBB1516794.1 hypothetical protein [Tessaracoccus sp. MC1679]